MQPVLQGVRDNNGTLQTLAGIATILDAFSPSFAGSPLVANSPLLFNGASYDRQRNNQDVVVLATAARTTTQTSATQTNHNARGLVVFLNISANSSVAGVTLKVFAVDPISGSLAQLGTTAAQTSTGLLALRIYPGITPVANSVFSDILPRSFVIQVVAGDASSVTYSVSFSLIV